jgi:hypothetical protein
MQRTPYQMNEMLQSRLQLICLSQFVHPSYHLMQISMHCARYGWADLSPHVNPLYKSQVPPLTSSHPQCTPTSSAPSLHFFHERLFCSIDLFTAVSNEDSFESSVTFSFSLSMESHHAVSLFYVRSMLILSRTLHFNATHPIISASPTLYMDPAAEPAMY